MADSSAVSVASGGGGGDGDGPDSSRSSVDTRRRRPKPKVATAADDAASMVSALSAIKKRVSADMTAQVQARSVQASTFAPSMSMAPPLGPVAQAVEDRMHTDFNAVQVRVQDLTYLTFLRARMGNRAWRHRGLEKTESSGLWSASILTMQLNPANGRWMPMPKSLGSTFKSEFKARAAADEAAAQRDLGTAHNRLPTAQIGDRDTDTVLSGGTRWTRPPQTAASGNDAATVATRRTRRGDGDGGQLQIIPDPSLDERYLRVMVVSERFVGKSLLEQLMLVYLALEEELWQPPGDQFATDTASRWRKYSVVGHHVRELPQFRIIRQEFVIEPKTPAAWAGVSRARERSGSVSSAATGSTAKKIHMSSFAATTTGHREPTALEIASQLEVTTAPKPKDVQRLVEGKISDSLEPMKLAIAAAYEEIKEARHVQKERRAAMAKSKEIWLRAGLAVDEKGKLVRVDPTPAAELVQSPSTGVSLAPANSALGGTAPRESPKKKSKKPKVSKAQQLMATFAKLYGDGSSKGNAEEEYRRRVLQLTIAARSLQRIYRQHVAFRALRLLRRHHRLSTEISRVWRGYVARQFAKELRRILTELAMLAQRLYRGHRGRKYVHWWRKVANEAALNIQRVARGMIGRKWWKFVFNYSQAAKTVQRVIRGFLGRCEARFRRRLKYREEVEVPAVVKIQAQWRRFLALSVVAARRQHLFHISVEIPAAIKIQSIFRMRAARHVRYRKALENWAAIEIQRIARGRGPRLALPDMLQREKERRAAELVQRRVRVWLAQRQLARRAYEHMVMTKWIPAASIIQRFYRGVAVRHVISTMRRNLRAAKTIQKAWRTFCATRAAKALWKKLKEMYIYRMASRLQAVYRGYAGRKRAELHRHVRNAAHIVTARKIQAWWRGVATRRAFIESMELAKIRTLKKRLDMYREDAEIMARDIVDIRVDIDVMMRSKEFCIKQLRALKREVNEMERRQPVVEEELSKLTVEDMNQGWGEAFQTEWTTLTNCLSMAAEETSMRKIVIRERDDAILDLRLELDDIEIDMDMCLTKELEYMEQLRLLEMSMCNKLWRRKWRREVAKQQCRWAVKRVRRNVVKRNYEVREAALADAEVQRRGGMEAITKWDEGRQHMDILVDLSKPHQERAHTPLASKPRYEGIAGAFAQRGVVSGGPGMFPQPEQVGKELAVAQSEPVSRAATTMKVSRRLAVQSVKGRVREQVDAARHAAQEAEVVKHAAGNIELRDLYASVVAGTQQLMQQHSFDMRRPKLDPRGNPEISLTEPADEAV